MIYEEVVVIQNPFPEALKLVKDSLAAQGFGTLTEIDLQATLAEKIGKEMSRFVIIGACNPHLASQAIDVDPQIGVLLPCNVVVRETRDGVVVEAMDPGLMAEMTDNAAVEPIAKEARRLINDALVAIQSAAMT